MKKQDDAAERSVKRIVADLNDRKGLGIDTLDKDTQKEIVSGWKKIIREEVLADSLEKATNAMLASSNTEVAQKP